MTAKNFTSRFFETAWNKKYPQWAEIPEQVRPRVELPARRLPRYVFDRVAVKVHALLDRRHPWVTEDALDLLDQLIMPTNIGLEYGSGGTTRWFAERVELLYSVDGNDGWCEATRQDLARRGLDNVDLTLASYAKLGYGTPAHREAYVNVQPDLEPGSLDFVFVDGEYRDECAHRALRLLRPGGLLILDNAEINVPGESRSPWRVERPITPLWEQVVDEISDWRRVWTTNGIWDTAFWIKP